MTNLQLLIEELRKHTQETEWIEFKVNNSDPDKIGKNLCAISNSATLCNRNCGYIIWGINDETHEVEGTSFDWRSC